MIYITDDGWKFRVFPTMYMDWGLEISRDDVQYYYSPHAISIECAGYNEEENTSWTEGDWKRYLKSEAFNFLEAFIVDCNLCNHPISTEAKRVFHKGYHWHEECLINGTFQENGLVLKWIKK